MHLTTTCNKKYEAVKELRCMMIALSLYCNIVNKNNSRMLELNNVWDIKLIEINLDTVFNFLCI